MEPENNNADNSRFFLCIASFSLRRGSEKPGRLKEIRSGLPMPRRRTFATALQAFAHSMPAALSASMPSLAANAGSRGMGSPELREQVDSV
jgi:hypothetical protein